MIFEMDDEDAEVVSRLLNSAGDPDEIVIRFDADTVQRGSIQTLGPCQWLNDEVVNHYIKVCLQNRDKTLCRDDTRKRSYCYNSFFAQNLFRLKVLDKDVFGVYDYSNVSRWGRMAVRKINDKGVKSIFDLK